MAKFDKDIFQFDDSRFQAFLTTTSTRIHFRANTYYVTLNRSDVKLIK